MPDPTTIVFAAAAVLLAALAAFGLDQIIQYRRFLAAPPRPAARTTIAGCRLPVVAGDVGDRYVRVGHVEGLLYPPAGGRWPGLLDLSSAAVRVVAGNGWNTAPWDDDAVSNEVEPDEPEDDGEDTVRLSALPVEHVTVHMGQGAGAAYWVAEDRPAEPAPEPKPVPRPDPSHPDHERGSRWDRRFAGLLARARGRNQRYIPSHRWVNTSTVHRGLR